MENIETRSTLEQLIRERGVSYTALSEMLGRNPAYIQQFIRKGSPRKLDEGDRRVLAEFLGVSEELLGAPKGRSVPIASESPAAGAQQLYIIPRLSIGASAGPGAFFDDEAPRGQIACDDLWLRKIGAKADMLSMIEVAGDSMEPSLHDGDEILVDRSDRPLRDGIYVLRMDDTLMVKRLALGPAGQLSVISDNDHYPSYENVNPDSIHIIGRVLWRGEAL